MKRPVTTLVEGLGHPEGPDVLPDGRIVMVETYTGKLVAWSSELGLHDYALCGGGPNACVLGSDGAVYLTQNGGTAGAWKAAVMSAPSIQRAWPDGRCETVADDGGRAESPGTQRPHVRTRRPSLFHRSGRLRPRQPGAGTGLRNRPRRHRRAARGPARVISQRHRRRGRWLDRVGRLLRSRRLSPGRRGRSELLCRLPDGHIPDGLKVDVDGNLWITAYSGGGVDIVRPDGTIIDFLETSGCPLNCVFHDGALFLTDLGDVGGVSDAAFMGGRLQRVDVGVEGMPLFRGAIT